jgi:acyl phosphate:glycerol-3-phosphate acyltransferase
MSIVIFCVLAYLIGSFPTSYIVVKAFRGVDIREHGSKNPGATNVFRVAGNLPGAITFVLDLLKGFLPVFFCYGIIKAEPTAVYLLVGLCAILGHTFPLFLGFRGGKGVATTAGVFLAVMPGPTLLCLLLFVLILSLTRYVSLGSMIAAVSLPFLGYALKADKAVILISVPLAIFVIYRHKENIKRLLNGTEHKIGEKK